MLLAARPERTFLRVIMTGEKRNDVAVARRQICPIHSFRHPDQGPKGRVERPVFTLRGSDTEERSLGYARDDEGA